jgi:hypothetical protein
VKKHVWRPLFVVLGLVAGILLFRSAYVPADFGAQEQGYTFGFHRLSNEQEWKNFPAKYRDSQYCKECHDVNFKAWEVSAHGIIPCENCHGAAFQHPDKPEKLSIDRSREQCLRCHSKLHMPSSGRNNIPGIDPEQHNTKSACIECHNPHHPSLEDM